MLTNKVGRTSFMPFARAVLYIYRNCLFLTMMNGLTENSGEGVNYVNNLSDLLSNGIVKHHNGFVQPDFYHYILC